MSHLSICESGQNGLLSNTFMASGALGASRYLFFLESREHLENLRI